MPRTRGYVALVHDLLTQHDGTEISLNNLSRPGETADSFQNNGQLAQLQNLITQLADAGTPIAAATLSLGGNEMLDAQGEDATARQSQLDAFSTSYPAALAEIRNLVGERVTIVVTTYYDLTSGNPNEPQSDAWWVQQFNDIIKQSAAASNAQVADVATVFEDHIADFTLWPIDVHPNNAGHIAIANEVWRAFGIDTVTPTIDLAPTIDASRSTPSIHFTGTDDTGIVDITISAEFATTYGPFSTDESAYVVLIIVSDGSQQAQVTVEARDAAGNVSTASTTVRIP
ncbi:MAG: SGNH/GDSL hydrolase family protein [Thermomicrobiales bacterium]|nr:SGNH/GDSL hydrolase family protein [Thermomicrobiales bacterium]